MNPSRFGIFTLGSDCASSTIVGPDDAVEIEDVGRHRVEFVAGQRFRLLERHRAPDVVEQRRRVGPVAADRLYRRLAGRERTDAADERIVRAARALLAVAGLALRGVDRFALRGGAAAGRKACAIRADADVPGRDVGGRDRLSELRGLRQRGSRDEGQSRRRRDASSIDIARLPLLVDAPACNRVVVIDATQAALRGNGRACRLHHAGVVGGAALQARPDRRSIATAARKRTGAFGRIGPCRAAGAQLCPPSADTSTCRMLPLPDQASPEIS